MWRILPLLGTNIKYKYMNQEQFDKLPAEKKIEFIRKHIQTNVPIREDKVLKDLKDLFNMK